MCGINGIFAYHYAANPISEAELTRTRDHMAARGPDARGKWVSQDRRLGFGHRRLSIIDLTDAGAQPMASADGRLVATFNGEIYNYRELRRGLEAQGHVFRSNSDTEVLLHLYAAKGSAMVHDLRGMFAFAIWDSTERVLFLARDPYGIKPLYYTDEGWTFRFASQVKALLAGGAVSRDPEPAGHVGFYLFGSVPEPFTTYREIRALPAGSTLLVNCTGAHAPDRYHSIAKIYREAEHRSADLKPMSQTYARAEVRGALLDSVRHHLVSDVPVGAFLSSGIDSSALVALMRDAGQQSLETVTLSFEEFVGTDQDEAPLASEVARLYGARHTNRVVTESEFAVDLPRILEAMDQPSVDGINAWFVSKAAREIGLKVAISGLGGDELFRGYPSFRDIPQWVNLFNLPSHIPVLGKAVRKLSQPFVQRFAANPKTTGMVELGGTYAGAYLLKRGLFMPWELSEVLPPDLVCEGLRRLSPLNLINRELDPVPTEAQARVSVLESSLYMKNQLLRDTDWASMAHSIEVRTPLVDSALLKRIAMLTASSKLPLDKIFLSEAPSQILPASIYNRAKTGFTTPIASWQRRLPLSTKRRASSLRASAKVPWARQWACTVAIA